MMVGMCCMMDGLWRPRVALLHLNVPFWEPTSPFRVLFCAK
jgi:hypothetical protein